jgi:hypothetical protein
MTLGADPLLRASPKSQFWSPCRNLFKHASKIWLFTAPVFMKSPATQYIFVDMPVLLYRYFPSWIKNTENTDNIYFITSSKVCLSLCQFSRNSKLINYCVYVRYQTTSKWEGNKGSTGNILFTPLRKKCLCLNRFSRNSKLINCCVYVRYQTTSKWEGNEGSTSNISFTPLRKKCLCLNRFSRNSQLIGRIICTFHMANFIQTEENA